MIYTEARHEAYTYPPFFFPTTRFLCHLKHGVFATWLYMVTCISPKRAEIPTKIAKFLPRWPQDGGIGICVGMTVK